MVGKNITVDIPRKAESLMTSPSILESANLTVLQARETLEDYERLTGRTITLEHKNLERILKAAQTYVNVLQSHSAGPS